MPHPRFVLSFKFSNVRAEAWVNDVPVGMLQPGYNSPASIPVNEFIVQGRNTVSIVLHAGPVPSQADQPWPNDPAAVSYHGAAKLSMTLALYQPEQNPLSDTPPPAASIEWEGVAAPLPERIDREFSISVAFGTWTWERATRFSAIDASLRYQAMDYLKFLHGLIATQQFDRFLDQSSLKLEEASDRAYAISSEQMKRSTLQMLQSHSQPPWVLDPLDPDTVDLRLVGSGRMIQCLRRDRSQVVQFRKPESRATFFLPLMIGRLGNAWVLLR